MTELFPVSLAEQIAAVEREIGMRQRVYPRWVEAKRMTADKAAKQIAAMEAVRDTLMTLRGNE